MAQIREYGPYPTAEAAAAAFATTHGAHTIEQREGGWSIWGHNLNANGRYEGADANDDSAKPSIGWSRADLVAYAAEHEVEHDSNATKREILDAIEAAG